MRSSIPRSSFPRDRRVKRVNVKRGRPARHLFRRCVEVYLDHLKVYGKPTTRHTAGNQSRRLLEFFEGMNPNTLAPGDISKYIVSRRANGVSDSTIKGELTILRALLNRAHDEGLIFQVVKITLPRVPKRRLPNILSKQEIKSVLKEVNKPWAEGFLRVALSTGLRNSEIRNLTWRDLDSESGELRISNKEDWSTKNRNERIVYLNDSVVEWLGKYRDQSKYSGDKDWIFANRSGGRYQVQSVCKEMRETFKRAGAYRKKRQTLHAIRHTFATELLSNGVDINVLRDLLGHQEITTTALYLHVVDEKRKSAVKKNTLLDD